MKTRMRDKIIQCLVKLIVLQKLNSSTSGECNQDYNIRGLIDKRGRLYRNEHCHEQTSRLSLKRPSVLLHDSDLDLAITRCHYFEDSPFALARESL